MAIRRGIYRHEVLGVFPDLASAEMAGIESVNEEQDHYHSVEILESVVATVRTEEQVRSVVEPTWTDDPMTNGRRRQGTYLGASVTRE